MTAITIRNQKQLWKHDIKIARDFNQTNNKTDGKEHLTSRLADEILSDFENGSGVYNSTCINTWSPMAAQTEAMPSVSGLGNTYWTSSQPWTQTMMLYQSRYRVPKPFARLHDDNRRFSLPLLVPHSSDSIPISRTNVHIENPQIVCTSSTPNDGSKYIGFESLNDSENEQPIFKNIFRKELTKFTVTQTGLDKP